MPWKSKQQARWGHSPAGVRALGGPDKVKEWDAATPKGSLPVKPKRSPAPAGTSDGDSLRRRRTR